MAGQGYKDFTAGAVLTAAQVDGYLMEQAVMNFAGTAARGSALSSVQSAGMMAHVGGGTVTVYDGSAWQQVYPAQAGLVYIAGTAFSAVSSVSVNNCFTSTYDNYKIIVTFTATTAADANVNFYYRASGTDTTTNYFRSGYINDAANLTTMAVADAVVCLPSTTYPTNAAFTIEPIRPQAAEVTRAFYSSTHLTNAGGGPFAVGGHLRQNSTTQFDGFSLVPASGNISGTVRVYGYRNS